MSDGMWFQKVINARDGFDGFWMCPTPNCDGAGFTFDIFPTDPNHPSNQHEGGWQWSDDGEDEIEQDGDYDPAEPTYAKLDQELGDLDEEDLEGEEWKHGLEPGERPPEPGWVSDARRQQEEEEARYDAPDERPRELDWKDQDDTPISSDRGGGGEGGISEDDIPF